MTHDSLWPLSPQIQLRDASNQTMYFICDWFDCPWKEGSDSPNGRVWIAGSASRGSPFQLGLNAGPEPAAAV